MAPLALLIVVQIGYFINVAAVMEAASSGADATPNGLREVVMQNRPLNTNLFFDTCGRFRQPTRYVVRRIDFKVEFQTGKVCDQVRELEILHNRELTSLVASALYAFRKARKISITMCFLTEVHPEVLGPSSEVVELDLSMNALTEFPKQLASNVKQLEVLYLNFNKIRRLQSRNFEALGNLMILELRGNLLQRLEADAFAGLGSLQLLDLDPNPLADLDPRLFCATPLLRRINLPRGPYDASYKFTGLANNTIVNYVDPNRHPTARMMTKSGPFPPCGNM